MSGGVPVSVSQRGHPLPFRSEAELEYDCHYFRAATLLRWVGSGYVNAPAGAHGRIYSLLPLAARAPLHAGSRAQGAARDAAALVLAGGATSRLPPPGKRRDC